MGRDEGHEITFEIRERLALLAMKKGGWRKELNYVAWNGDDPKFDVRDWSPDHLKMGRGVTITDEEMMIAVDAYREREKRMGTTAD